MRKSGMTLNHAMQHLRSRRPEVEPIPAFMEQLRQYEQKCIDSGAIKPSEGKTVQKRKMDFLSAGPARRPMVGPSMPPGANRISCSQKEEKIEDARKGKVDRKPIGPARAPVVTTLLHDTNAVESQKTEDARKGKVERKPIGPVRAPVVTTVLHETNAVASHPEKQPSQPHTDF
jgi:hypothetical protein